MPDRHRSKHQSRYPHHTHYLYRRQQPVMDAAGLSSNGGGSTGNFTANWRNQASGFLLDNPSGSTTPGTFVQQWAPNGLSPQQWTVTYQNP